MVHQYTTLENSQFIAYVAENNPSRRNRLGNKLYQQLVANEEWAQDRSWTAWREHYKRHREELDQSIARYQDRRGITRSPSPPSRPPKEPSQPLSNTRNPFTSKEDKQLVKFLAEMSPVKFQDKRFLGRGGNALYRDILSDLTKYPWASTHPWQSWRDRYAKNQGTFDDRIARWQEKNGIDPDVQLQIVNSEYANGSNRTIPEVLDKVTKHVGLDHERNKDDSPPSHENKRSGPEEDGEDMDQSTNVDVRPLKKRKYGKASNHRSHSDFKKINEVSSSRVGSPSNPEPPIRQTSPNEGDEVERHDDEDPDPNFGRGNNSDPQDLPFPEEVLDQVLLNIPHSSRPSNNLKDAGPLYPTLPTPISDTPHRLPGDYPDSLSDVPETVQMSRKVLAPAMRSHPPTPPPTNEHSELSELSRSVEPYPPMLSAVAKGKQRAVPSPSPTENTFQPRDVRPTGVAKSLQASRSAPHQSPRKSLTSASQSQRPLPSCSPLASSLSDEDFTTGSPAPKRTEVVRGLPKTREKSFRNSDRVRTRKVVVAQRESFRRPDGDDKGQKKATLSRSRVGEERNLEEPGIRVPSKPTSPIKSPGGFESASSFRHERTGQSATSNTLLRQETDALEHYVHKAPPNAASMLASQDPDRHALNNPGPSHFPVEAADIFVSTTPQSDRDHKPYALGTSHLPPETGTSISSQNHSTPLLARHTQWDRKRRRTFPNLGPYPRMPDINLVEELDNERAKSRSSVSVWTRGSPDITLLPKAQSERAASSSLLSGIERAYARRGPPRKSVIPVMAHSEAQNALPFFPKDLSPSTFKIIIREGLAASFKRLEKTHGFSVEVVERTWLKQNMDLLATDKKLHGMRIAAEMAADRDGEIDFANGSVSNWIKAKERYRSFEEYTRAMHPSAIATQPMSSTDYTPPARSRAAHYRRFMEQGRHWEARQREIDLASRVSADSSPSSVAPAPRPETPVWGEEEDEALRASSETALRELASRFGDKVLRQKSLTLMMLDD